jgi:hypothetical protein
MTAWSSLTALATTANVKSALQVVGTAGLTLVGLVFKDWWGGRDRFRAHVTWTTYASHGGPEETPVIYIQNESDRPLNIINCKICDARGRKTDEYPFETEDPNYDPFPKTIKPHEHGHILLYHKSLAKVAERAGPITNRLRRPRVFVSLTTMSGKRRLFVAERGLPWNVRWARYRE